MPHTNFLKVAWVVFVEGDPVATHATSITLDFWLLPVYADVAVAVAHVAPNRLENLNKCFVYEFVKTTEKEGEGEGLKGFEKQCFYRELAPS